MNTHLNKHLIVAIIALLLTIVNLVLSYVIVEDRNYYRDRYHSVSAKYRELIKETGR